VYLNGPSIGTALEAGDIFLQESLVDRLEARRDGVERRNTHVAGLERGLDGGCGSNRLGVW
jgi:hypothetical protein